MGRVHLFEFEDLPRCPALWRRGITDLLHHQLSRYGLYRPIAGRLAALMRETQQDRLLDLCSGSAGPVVTLLPALSAAAGRPIEVTLSDRFPNLDAFRRHARASAGQVRFHTDPLDATAVPTELPGVRTIFTAFHHFRPPLARAILADAARSGRPLAIFEFTERTWANALKSVLLGPFLVWADTVSMRPLVGWRWFWTYLLPAIPLVYAWDALVSHLRTYSPEELRELVDGLSSDDYRWEIGQTGERVLGYRITYVIGQPATPPVASPGETTGT